MYGMTCVEFPRTARREGSLVGVQFMYSIACPKVSGAGSDNGAEAGQSGNHWFSRSLFHGRQSFVECSRFVSTMLDHSRWPGIRMLNMSSGILVYTGTTLLSVGGA